MVDASELTWAMREVTRMSTEVEHGLARRLRLRPLEHAALGHLLDSGHQMGPAELSARLGISTGSGTELVDRLERAGHIRRDRDTRDRRRVALHVTPSAVQQVLRQLAPLMEGMDRLSERFTVEEQRVIVRYLRAAAVAMKEFADTAPADD